MQCIAGDGYCSRDIGLPLCHRGCTSILSSLLIPNWRSGSTGTTNQRVSRKYHVFPVLCMPYHGASTLECVSLVRIAQKQHDPKTPPATIRWVHSSNRPARHRPVCLALPHAVSLAGGISLCPYDHRKSEHIVSRECPNYPVDTFEKREAMRLSLLPKLFSVLCSGLGKAGATLSPTVLTLLVHVSHTRVVLLITMSEMSLHDFLARTPSSRPQSASLVSGKASNRQQQQQ